MKLQTFTAATMAQALHRVKAEMGHDAVILHTRTYRRRRWMGLGQREVVEITAGTGMAPAAAVRKPRRPPAREATGLLPFGQAPAPGGAPEPPRKLLESPAAGNAIMLGMSQEVGALKSMVNELVTQTRMQAAPQVPEDLFDCYMQLIQAQVAQEIAVDVLKTIRQQLTAEQIKQPALVRQKLMEQLEKLLAVSGPIVRRKTTGPHVVALIGPTGVGKTTTIAKLAANLRLRQGHAVALITIDTYRIAAVDQLRKYADIIGAPLRVVMTPQELKEAVAAMSSSEFVLIDTAGRSPNDALKLAELKAFLAAAEPDEVHLVISTTQSQESIELTLARFQNVRVDKVILTKFDEALHVGVMLSVMRKVNKSLSYVTTGQNVPDDIEVAHPHRLAQFILGAQP